MYFSKIVNTNDNAKNYQSINNFLKNKFIKYLSNVLTMTYF